MKVTVARGNRRWYAHPWRPLLVLNTRWAYVRFVWLGVEMELTKEH